jgi:CheY-specific phosphatase CheX
MSVEKIQESLTEAVQQTFGEMAFIDVLPAEAESIEHSQIMVLEITIPVRGFMYLIMPKECKRQVVENIHGDSWDVLNAAQIDDCLLELLNVLGGNFLSSFYGESVKYSLSFPQVIFDESELPNLNKFMLFGYDAEGSNFAVALQLENQGAHE